MNKINIQTLYRKYRPKTFNDILGQEEVVLSLKNSIKNKNISHAYFFTGCRGSGKTSTARIFANQLEIDEIDIYEIDAASNRKIDEIRTIREQVNIFPVYSKYKIYIIDEVHMLTKEAFNALLKVLEEPPSHIIFIFATTEKEKVLDTIKSRCQIINFKRASLKSLKELILKITKEEKIKIDEKSVEFIAKLGDGSFRDTVSFLQKVISIFEKKINYKDIDGLFTNSNPNLENDFLLALNNKKKEEIFNIYLKLKEENINFNNFFLSILEKIRISLLIRNSNKFEEIYKKRISEEEIKFLNNLTNINSSYLKKILEFNVLIKKTEEAEIAFEIFILELF